MKMRGSNIRHGVFALGLIASALFSCMQLPTSDDALGDYDTDDGDDGCAGSSSCPSSGGAGGSGGAAGSAGSAGSGGAAAPCLQGKWSSPTCGGARAVTLSFESNGHGEFTNPDCTGRCQSLVFPYSYTVAGKSVTLHYGVPNDFTCEGVSGPRHPDQPKDDSMTFTCEGDALETETSLGKAPYTRIGGSSGGSGGSGGGQASGGTGGTGALSDPGGVVDYWNNGPWHGHLYAVSSGATTTIERNGRCASGVVPADATFQTNALLGWNINQLEGSQLALRWTPSSPDLSLQYDITAASGAPFQLNIIDGTGQVWCVRLANEAGSVRFQDFNTRCWDDLGEPYDGVTPIKDIQVLVQSEAAQPRPFNFCVKTLIPY